MTRVNAKSLHRIKQHIKSVRKKIKRIAKRQPSNHPDQRTSKVLTTIWRKFTGKKTDAKPRLESNQVSTTQKQQHDHPEDSFAPEQKMKVLMLGWELPPYNSGGLGVASYELAKALSDRIAEVIFVLPRRVDLNIPFLRLLFASHGISFEEINKQLKIKGIDTLLSPYITPEEYKRQREEIVSTIYSTSIYKEVHRYALAVRKIAKEETFDVIHAHEWLSFQAGAQAKHISGKPLVAHVHATEFDRCGGNNINPNIFAVEKEGLKESDRIITVSNFTKNRLVHQYDIPHDKIDVVYNGINSDNVPALKLRLARIKESGRKIVLYVGRITLQKGPDYFIRAAKKVARLYPNVLFIMTGAGDMQYQVINQAAYSGLSDKIIFTGFLRGNELYEIYQAADVFVMPSVSEPFGIAALESLSNGTPIIISKQSGVAEVVPHALKVDFWDIEEMANQIVAILQNPGIKKFLIQGGKHDLEDLSWKKAAVNCYQTYQRVIKA